MQTAKQALERLLGATVGKCANQTLHFYGWDLPLGTLCMRRGEREGERARPLSVERVELA